MSGTTTIWQIASGDGGRDYSRFLIQHDLMLLGPGAPGEYTPERYAPVIASGQLTKEKASALGRFRTEVHPGDRVLLRKGRRVVAIGVVADPGYQWNEAFDDVSGWDLQHTHRVCWKRELSGELEIRQRNRSLFGGRIMIPMFTRVEDEQVLSPIRDLLTQLSGCDLRPLPKPPSAVLDDAALGRELFSKGLSNRATEDVIFAINRQRRLLEWYADHGRASRRPSEHEVVAHMVLPLLLALGWSEQLLAVEWNRIDLAGFSAAPTTGENCSLVCETKGLGHGLSDVLDQALNYVERLELSSCRRILLTEGGRYYVYSRREAEWSHEPAAYFNVFMPRARYSDGTSAIDAILALRQP